MATLQYAPWTSDIELAFYAALASLKINHDRLNDSARKVLGLYEIRPVDRPERSGRMQIYGTALTTDEYVLHFRYGTSPRRIANRDTQDARTRLPSCRGIHQEL